MTNNNSLINSIANNTINKEGWLPSYFHNPKHEYIFLTSLNLGGAEKIVCDQLWANHYSKFPTSYTLIVLYDKEKEHSIPPNVNIVRLKSKIENGDAIFKQIASENKILVCHLINDKIANYLFSHNVKINFVLHNDRRAWSNSDELLKHSNIITVVTVCEYVKEQAKLYTDKPVISIRHQIKYNQHIFSQNLRDKIRGELKLVEQDIVIGMVGRIAEQKNYPLAIDSLHHLVQKNPNYKLIIVGGFEKKFVHIYMDLLNRINLYKLHKNVQLLGFRKDIKEITNAFDIALNTSYFEGLSMAIQELMGNGLPIVLSDVCGQKEIYDSAKQLNFFQINEKCSDLNTLKFNYFNHPPEYMELILDIANKIETSSSKSILNNRIKIDTEHLQEISRLSYASHRLWSLFNHIKTNIKTNENKTAFLTSNLNLGGAQRSLVNLMIYIQKNKEQLSVESNFNPTLMLINQSNQNQFLNELAQNKVPCFIAQSSTDVFDIMKNMLDFIEQENINQIVFWNVESKIKLLLTKLLGHQIKFIDVSPGDYIFNEIRNETDFQEAISYHGKSYYSDISQFVSKYYISQKNEFLNQLKNSVTTIPNGVYINENYIKEFNGIPEIFNFLVCGRIAPSKHLEIIFEAFRLLNNELLSCKALENLTDENPLSTEVKQITLNIIGNTEECFKDYYLKLQNDYKDLIEKNQIVFLGYNDNPQAVMKNYDCIIVLGTHQGSPNTVLEAGACNLPVISNDSGGTKEIIGIDTGILLPSTPDVSYLTEAMKDMINQYPMYKEKSIACHNKIVNDFSMQTMAKKYLELLFKGEKK